jgi:hypothetical protein
MFVPTLRGLTLAGALVYLIALDRATPANVIWTVVVVAVLLLLIEVLEGSGLAREATHAGAVRAEAVQADAEQERAGAGPSAG